MSLVRNIKRRQDKGISRSKQKSTITAKSYAKMQAGWPKSKSKSKSKS